MATTASTRGTNMFLDSLFILDTLANKKGGMTVGEIGKVFQSLTRRQIQKIVDNLENGGMVFVETVPHGRTGKKKYRVAEYTAMVCASIARGYTS